MCAILLYTHYIPQQERELYLPIWNSRIKHFSIRFIVRQVETHFRLNASLQLLNSTVPCLARARLERRQNISAWCGFKMWFSNGLLGILNLGYLFHENKTMYSINLKLIWKIHKAGWTPHYRGGSPGLHSTSLLAGNEELPGDWRLGLSSNSGILLLIQLPSQV